MLLASATASWFSAHRIIIYAPTYFGWHLLSLCWIALLHCSRESYWIYSDQQQEKDVLQIIFFCVWNKSPSIFIQRKTSPFWTYISKFAECCSSTESQKELLLKFPCMLIPFIFIFHFSCDYTVLLILMFLCADKWVLFLWKKLIFKCFQSSLRSWFCIQIILLIDLCFFLASKFSWTLCHVRTKKIITHF